MTNSKFPAELNDGAVGPAIVAGPFFGTLIMLGMLVHSEERDATVVALPAAPAPRASAARPA